MDPHERRHERLVSRRGPPPPQGARIEIIEAEIRSAQYEVLLEAARLVLIGSEPVAIARELRARAERIIRPTS